MPYGLSVTACCVLLSIILPFCFSEQDLLDILLVRHSVDYYHCDCRPNLQTTTAFQLQIAKWVIAVNIQFFLSFSIFQKRTQKNENIIKLQWVFLLHVCRFTYWPQACQKYCTGCIFFILIREKILVYERPIFQKTLYSIHNIVKYITILDVGISFGCATHILLPPNNFFIF